MSEDGKVDPILAAQRKARQALPERFYQDVTVGHEPGAHGVLLDGRALRTPAKAPLVAPRMTVAEAIAAEWRAQERFIDPATMPVTRLVNVAIDGVANAIDDVRTEIAEYAASDLICYRADGPEGLVRSQMQHWDPLIAWARETLGAPLNLAEGVMHVDQPEGSADRIADTAGRDPFQLAAFVTITTLTGSAVIAAAIRKARLSPEDAWAAAHVDEDWQIGQWGEDHEAKARRAARWLEMQAAALVLGADD